MKIIDADHLRQWILSRVFKTQLSVADVIDQIDREDCLMEEEEYKRWMKEKESSDELHKEMD